MLVPVSCGVVGLGGDVCKDSIGLVQRKRSIKGSYDSRVPGLPLAVAFHGLGWSVLGQLSG